MKNPLYPLKMQPFLRDYIWGGTKLKDKWNKVSHMDKIAESWELSTFSKMESRVAGGKYNGKTLLEMKEFFPDIFGDNVEEFPLFPLLIKLIDAENDLSIQVHPSDEYALIHEMELGKTEGWYIADAEENGSIYYGFNRDVTPKELRESIQNNTLTSLLNHIKVKKGDFFFVPAGTVHAILKGVTVVEIQQSSSLTYRLYDYGRVDTNGKPRELHIEKALKVINTKKQDLPSDERVYLESVGYKTRALASSKYFTCDEVVITESYPVFNKDSFVTFTVVEGEGRFENDYKVIKGDTFFVPAGHKTEIFSHNLTVIVTSI